MRVFLDTNVLVAAFATRGLCADMLRLVLAHHELVISAIVMEELQRVLADKIGLPSESIARIHELLAPYLATEQKQGPTAFSIRDASDIAVVASAIAAQTDVLVTGDRDLLDAELPLQVVTPRAFWEKLRALSAADEVHER